MIVEILTADSGSGMRIGVVSPAEDAGMRYVIREQTTEPVNAITRGPRPFTVAVEAMDGDDTDEGKQ